MHPAHRRAQQCAGAADELRTGWMAGILFRTDEGLFRQSQASERRPEAKESCTKAKVKEAKRAMTMEAKRGPKSKAKAAGKNKPKAVVTAKAKPKRAGGAKHKPARAATPRK